jgi:integrase
VLTRGTDHLTMSGLLTQHIAVLQYEGARPSTISDRRRCILRLHDDLPHGVLYATSDQLQAWLGYEKWDQWTRYTYYSHLAGFYRWLKKAGLRDDNPMERIKRPKQPTPRPRPATDEQIQLALAAPEPVRTAALLAYYQGMRRAEIAGCCREHITEQQTLIPVAKGGEAQTVPTHPAVWAHVRDIPPSTDPRHPRYLITVRGRPISPDRLSDYVRRWAISVGIIDHTDPRRRKWGLHRLRHSFGTDLQRLNRDLRVTQECLRHKSVRSTQIYTAVTDDQRRAAVAMLPWIGHRPGVGRPVPDAED